MTRTATRLAVTGHQLPWRYRKLPDRVTPLLPALAVRTEAHLRESLPDTRVVVTTARGIAELSIAADIELTGQPPAAFRRWSLASSLRREAGENQGTTCATPAGALILLRDEVVADASDRQLAVLVAHELVHAAQFGRPERRASLHEDALCRLGLARRSRREQRVTEHRVRTDELEAYAAEQAIAHTATAPRRRWF